MNVKNGVEPVQIAIKPKAIANFVIDKETLDQLSGLHKLAALAAIRDGRWKLVGSDGEVIK